MAGEDTAVEDIIDTIATHAQDRDRITLGDLMNMLDRRGAAPFLVVLPLIELTPLGAIPGVPSALALVIAVFAVQLAIGREDLWLPGILARRGVSSERLSDALDKVRPVAAWMDRHFGRRLSALTGPHAAQAAGIVILALCLLVPPSELIPWASSAPMLAIAALGIALLFRDGLMMGTGFAAAAAGAGAALWWLL